MNQLSVETSPYLKQHENNPVNWYAWGEAAWKKAREEDKLVLVSIGYSACHWCHVMEHESFEDEETAAIMNELFICIKVDREERPDIDQVYMEAIQAMHGSGGWPLNCFTLPDGRPVHGGTYFRNEEWKKTLLALNNFYQEKRESAFEYATRLQDGLGQMKFDFGKPIAFTPEKMDSLLLSWQNTFDMSEGGQDRQPKFPLPNNYEFLMHFGVARKNKFILNFLHLTLHKMAWGGIYDQVGGGFARYSVDRLWHAPHFEKMLYDNAQLISLYSHAYQLTQNSFYKQIIDESVAFVLRELTHPSGGFFSALDADSEGKEGKFYVWNKDEFAEALSGEVFETPKFIELAASYYEVTEVGNWHGEETNILKCVSSVSDFCSEKQIDEVVFNHDLKKAKEILMSKRSFRVRPGLDDKIITSWNALMIKALADAYNATGEEEFLKEAKRNYLFIKQKLWTKNALFHTFHYSSQEAKIHAFLDDYVFLADAAISIYQCTFNDNYLHDAKQLVDLILEEYKDEQSDLFYFTGTSNENLFVRKHEVHDNVIPASNSVLATVFYKLGRYFENNNYTDKATSMLNLMQPRFSGYPSGYSQWLQLQMLETFGLNTVCITGNDQLKLKSEFNKSYLPHVIFAGGENSAIPVMQNKISTADAHIHICTDAACMPPQSSVEEALKILIQ